MSRSSRVRRMTFAAVIRDVKVTYTHTHIIADQSKAVDKLTYDLVSASIYQSIYAKQTRSSN